MWAMHQPIVGGTIHVVATTIDGTKAALVAAKREAKLRGAGVVLLVPTVEAPDTPGEESVDATNWRVARYRRLVREAGQPVQIRICPCGNVAQAAAPIGSPNNVLFVGGPMRWLWLSAEQRMAATLRRSGHHVVFVGCNRD